MTADEMNLLLIILMVVIGFVLAIVGVALHFSVQMCDKREEAIRAMATEWLGQRLNMGSLNFCIEKYTKPHNNAADGVQQYAYCMIFSNSEDSLLKGDPIPLANSLDENEQIKFAEAWALTLD